MPAFTPLDRRAFLIRTAATGLALQTAPLWAASHASARPKAQAGDILITVFQRGAADALHSVVPVGDGHYFDLRPQIAVADAIDLDGFFGLNPALSSLLPLWDANELALVHAAGSPSNSRSHFDAQDFMEWAYPGKNVVNSGWLGRHLMSLDTGNASAFRAVSFNGAINKSLAAEGVTALTLSSIAGFDLQIKPALHDAVSESTRALFDGESLMAAHAQTLFGGIDTLQALNPDDYPVENGAQYPDTPFGNKLQQLAVLIKADVGIEVATADIGGWDHHDNINQFYPDLAQEFADSLAAFRQDLSDHWHRITVLCMTEFGRRAGQNASSGTDHGHGSVMYVLGGAVNGGQVYGQWPGLAPSQLDRGDLAVTTDFREVFGEVLSKRLNNNSLATVLPDFNYQGGIGLFD